MKTSRVTRIVKLLMVLQSSQSYHVSQLAEMFGLSRRTVFRDLSELKKIGVPCRFDVKNGRYSIDPEFFLPPIDLNLQEALSLLMLLHKGRKSMQVPFQNSALMAGLKIENNLPEKIRSYYLALTKVSIKPSPQAPMNLLCKTFTELQKAVTKKRKIELNYHSLFDKKDITLTIWPLHLFFNNRAWYLIGHSEMHNSVRTFKLNRINRLEILGKCFVTEKEFDLFEHLGRAWSMIPEGRIYHIRLQFSPMVAENVSEVQWHSTQKVTRNKDGSATLEFRIDGLREISWWILGYGDQVKVIAPTSLKRKIAETAKNVAKING